MAVDTFDDLEPVSDLLSRCEWCGDCFVTDHQLNMHITHAVECGESETVEVDGIDHRLATEF